MRLPLFSFFLRLDLGSLGGFLGFLISFRFGFYLLSFFLFRVLVFKLSLDLGLKLVLLRLGLSFLLGFVVLLLLAKQSISLLTYLPLAFALLLDFNADVLVAHHLLGHAPGRVTRRVEVHVDLLLQGLVGLKLQQLLLFHLLVELARLLVPDLLKRGLVLCQGVLLLVELLLVSF